MSRAKVRMYRHGLGDCLLLTLPRFGGDFFMLIDCGLIHGTSGAVERMQAVVDDVVATTGGRLDVLVITHAHWDHVSGLSQAERSFREELEIGQVWMAWTEDPADAFAQSLLKDRDRAVSALQLSAQRLRLGGSESEADEVSGLLDFFGGAPGRTEGAMAVARSLRPPQYLRPGQPPIRPPGVEANIFVLGPPRNATQIRRSDPSKRTPETYHLAGFRLGLGELDPGAPGEDEGRPFTTQYEIPIAIAQGMTFFRNHYWTGDPAQDWRIVDSAFLGGAVDLALKLDEDTNNTSLVLAVELGDGGPVLLFAADAQVGSWLSWHDVSWTLNGRTVTGTELIERTVVYKVGHHGSHNATLRQQGLELMRDLRVALIPVDEAAAKKKRWNKMPLPGLLDALGTTAVRADREGPLPDGVSRTDLYYEVSL